MPTLHQLFLKNRINKKKKFPKKLLKSCPQKKGVILQTRFVKPKKPNSAIRKVAKVILSNGRTLIASIPGQTHNLQEHSHVLVRGGRIPDLPGVNYKLIKGKFDFSDSENFERKQRRSKFGIKKSTDQEKLLFI